MEDLRQRTVRGGLARICAQGANFVLRAGSLMVLARLLGPTEFGLVGMVTAFTGVMYLFRDFGLSAAAIQRPVVTDEEISTLFWINMGVGLLLGGLAVALAPAIAAFYREPRLFGVAAVLAAGFAFNAAGVQHQAILQRQLRFTALAVINTTSLVIGTVLAIVVAVAGYGYWALVALTVSLPLTTTVLLWLSTAWVPGMPHRGAGIRSMMRFGGTVTLSGTMAYVASNFEKILIGRFWGTDAIGIYGRAYQLINIPTENLNSAAGEVAFSVLSRLQDDPGRLKRYFLKGYSLVLTLTLPVTIACLLFADDMIFVFLGPKWKAATVIFRVLAPTVLVCAIVNPLVWFLSSIGLVGRTLKVTLVVSPFMIAGYVMGLPYGPTGVAFAYSSVMTLSVIPLVAWCVHGTVISFRDILLSVSRPLAASLVAASFALGVRFFCGQLLSPLPRLVLESSFLFVPYFALLLFVAGEKALYLDVIRALKSSPAAKEESLVST